MFISQTMSLNLHSVCSVLQTIHRLFYCHCSSDHFYAYNYITTAIAARIIQIQLIIVYFSKFNRIMKTLAITPLPTIRLLL